MATRGIYRLILLVTSLWAIAGCSSSAARDDRLDLAGITASGNPVRCALVPERLSISRLSPAAVEHFLVSADGKGAGQIKVERVLAIRGDCLDAIVGYQAVADIAYLSDGRILSVEPHPKPAADHYKYVDPALSSLPGPRADPHFVMADRVAYIKGESGTAEVFVGVWTEPEGSSIRLFRMNASGQLDGSRVLLHSLRPVMSLRYLPAPDTPWGTLSITIRGDDSLLLARLGLIHPDWAATFE